MNPLRALLNKHRWSADLAALWIDYDFRVDDQPTTATIGGGRIVDIAPGGLTLSGEERESFLPYHRISRVRAGQTVLYERGS